MNEYENIKHRGQESQQIPNLHKIHWLTKEEDHACSTANIAKL